MYPTLLVGWGNLTIFSDHERGVRSSRWHHVAQRKVPPGLRTLATSASQRVLSGMCSPLSRDHTCWSESQGLGRHRISRAAWGS